MQSKLLMNDTTTMIKDKMFLLDEKLRVTKAESPLEVNEEWHAEISQEVLSDVEKL